MIFIVESQQRYRHYSNWIHRIHRVWSWVWVRLEHPFSFEFTGSGAEWICDFNRSLSGFDLNSSAYQSNRFLPNHSCVQRTDLGLHQRSSPTDEYFRLIDLFDSSHNNRNVRRYQIKTSDHQLRLGFIHSIFIHLFNQQFKKYPNTITLGTLHQGNTMNFFR